MTPSEDLFELIRALKKSEKRHFKLFTGKHVVGEGNFYIQLFDAIEKQEKYDEQEIKKMLKDTASIKHLPMHKNYLYTLVLKSLRVFYSNKTKTLQTKELLEYAEILYIKKQYTQASKILKKIKSIVHENENYFHLLEALWFEKNIATATSYQNMELKGEDKILKEETLALGEYKLQCELWNLRIKAAMLNKVYGSAVSNTKRKEFLAIINDPILSQPSGSQMSKESAYSILSTCYYSIGDLMNSVTYLKKSLDIIADHPARIVEKPLAYVQTTNNLVTLSIQLNKYDDAIDAIRKLRSVLAIGKTPDTGIEVEIFQYGYTCEMQLVIKMGTFENSSRIIEEVMSGLRKFKNSIRPLHSISLPYFISYLHFINGNFRDSLKWCNKVIKEENLTRTNIQVEARFILLAVRYEMDDTEMINYHLKAVKKYVEEMCERKEFPVYYIMLNFFENLDSAGGGSQISTLLEETRSKLSNVQQSSPVIFDFTSWLESHLRKKSFAEIIRQKAEATSRQVHGY